MVLVPGIGFAVASQTGSSYVPPTFSARAGGILLIAAMSFTLIGLVAFDLVLWRAGDRVLSGLGTGAYVAAMASWAIATGRALAVHEWTYDLEVVFIVGAGFAMLAFGASVIRTRAIPRWVGWIAMGWSAGGLLLFAMPHQGYPPLVPQLIPPLFGVALLRAARRTSSRTPADLAV